MSHLEINEYNAQSEKMRSDSLHFQRRMGGLPPLGLNDHRTLTNPMLPSSQRQLPPLGEDIAEEDPHENAEERLQGRAKARKRRNARRKQRKSSFLTDEDEKNKDGLTRRERRSSTEDLDGLHPGDVTGVSDAGNIIDNALNRGRRRRAKTPKPQSPELHDSIDLENQDDHPDVNIEYDQLEEAFDMDQDVQMKKNHAENANEDNLHPEWMPKRKKKRKARRRRVIREQKESRTSDEEYRYRTGTPSPVPSEHMKMETEKEHEHADEYLNEHHTENNPDDVFDSSAQNILEESTENIMKDERDEDMKSKAETNHPESPREHPLRAASFEDGLNNQQMWGSAQPAADTQQDSQNVPHRASNVQNQSSQEVNRFAKAIRFLASFTTQYLMGRTKRVPLASTPTTQRLPLFRKTIRFKEDDVNQSVLSMFVHRTDILKASTKTRFPVVKVTVVDTATGNLLKKSNIQSEDTRFEQKMVENGKDEYIMPSMTSPFDMRHAKNVIPSWEEEVLFDQEYSHFLKENIVIIFEILDISHKATHDHDIKDMNRIAWAFVKGVSASGRSHTERHLRLQLYKYPESNVVGSTLNRFRSTIEKAQKRIDTMRSQNPRQETTSPRITHPIHFAWSDTAGLLNATPRRRYPSSLYLTMRAAKRPASLTFSQHPKTETSRLREEENTPSSNEPNKVNTASHEDEQRKQAERRRQHWKLLQSRRRRERRQPCVIPDKSLFQLETGAKGCIVAKFSHSGDHLACACYDSSSSPIIKVFSMLDGSIECRFSGQHFGLVYDLDWNEKDTMLLSASSDGSVKVWDVATAMHEENGEGDRAQDHAKQDGRCLACFQHPTFVYTAKFHPAHSNILVTGAYDHKMRIWDIGSECCTQVISGHKARITWIEFEPEGNRMYSADSGGVICIWSARMAKSNNEIGPFSQLKYIDIPELMSSSITCIRVDPTYPLEQLLVHSQDNVIRLVDLVLKKVKSRYTGVKCYLNAQKSAFSPDGKFIVSGSSDSGRAFFWRSDSLELKNREGYDFGFGDRNVVYDIAWSPRDHMVALCSYGAPEPIRVYVHEDKEREAIQQQPQQQQQQHEQQNDADMRDNFFNMSALSPMWKDVLSLTRDLRTEPVGPTEGAELPSTAVTNRSSLGLPISPIPLEKNIKDLT